MGEFDPWLGRVEVARDVISAPQARRLAATLDTAGITAPEALTDGAPLPPLWHWIGFLTEAPLSGLGRDGHPARGGFLPLVPLERRMWAGGRLTFHAPLRIGQEIEKRSEILKIAEKTGGAGRMVFVTVEHRLSGREGLCITEEQDIVYVAMPDRYTPPPPVAAPDTPEWVEEVLIDPVRLYRYSACTFNGHRIHYDLAYATGVEGYPGLVVHGPMQATMILEAARRHHDGAVPRSYSYRGVRPVFHFDTLRVMGTAPQDGVQSAATVTGEGYQAMQGRITW